MGDWYPFENRDVHHRDFIFQLQQHIQAEQTYYMRVESYTVTISLILWSAKALAEKINDAQMMLGMFYGTMMVMVFYNLFIFVSVRDPNYLYYVFYITSVILVLVAENGLGFQYLWPHSVAIQERATTFLLGVTGGMMNIQVIQLI